MGREMRVLSLPEGALEALDIPGSSELATLVLLHEGLGSARLWREFPGLLATETGARCFAYSRFGHGHSDPPARPLGPSFMHEEALDRLPRILAQAEIERPILVGHSDGASIALIAASALPVRAVVAIAPHVFVEDLTIRAIRAIREEYGSGLLKQRMARHHRGANTAFRGWSGVWLDPRFREWSLEPLLPSIAVPTLLIQGEQDEYGTLAQLDAIERGVGTPLAQRLVMPGGHWPHLSHTQLVVDAIARFVTDLPDA
jgi:pimeloyl-ACP methyl ester carboxylesterase